MVQLNFDASTVEPSAGIETKPEGWYNVAIDESEMKPTKDGSGAYLQLRFNILDGHYSGQKFFTRFNLRNANPVAVEIAYKELSAVAHAVGILQIGDSEQLHGRPMKVKVKIRKDPSGQYDDQNDIKSYKNVSEDVGPMAGAAYVPGPTVAPMAPPIAPAIATPPPPATAAPAAAPPAQPWEQPPAPPAQQGQAAPVAPAAAPWAPQPPAPAAAPIAPAIATPPPPATAAPAAAQTAPAPWETPPAQ